MQEINKLEAIFIDKSWFRGVDIDGIGRFVIYTSTMSKEICDMIPDRFNGKQVLLHFDVFRKAKSMSYIQEGNRIPPDEKVPYDVEPVYVDNKKHIPAQEPKPEIIVTKPNENKNDVSSYISQILDTLEDKYGVSTVETIFYEIHDGENALTNLSDRYPEVNDKLGKLYHAYGFNPIYNELDS